eukprot:scaffold97763_cov33-Tisochrysis_lutea.AAC.5
MSPCRAPRSRLSREPGVAAAQRGREREGGRGGVQDGNARPARWEEQRVSGATNEQRRGAPTCNFMAPPRESEAICAAASAIVVGVR